jgi:hypothetical protein
MDIDKIISLIRNLKEEGGVMPPTNNASSGAIAGLPPDQPPVFKKKRENPTIIGRGRFPGARTRWRKGL